MDLIAESSQESEPGNIYQERFGVNIQLAHRLENFETDGHFCHQSSITITLEGVGQCD